MSEASATLAALVAASDQAITIVDAGARVLEWNQAAERLYGIRRESIVGQLITAFFSPASLMVRRVLESGLPVASTYHQPRPGTHVLVTAVPILVDGQLSGALAVETDMTRVVDLSNELVTARDRLQALQRQLTPQPPVGAEDDDPFRAMWSRNPATARTIDLARRIAPTEALVLISGESGVGKEVLARSIHRASRHAAGPFLALNCGAIPASLFEAELFGYAPGAFTGASPKGQPGKLELADSGTLFLDEVGDLPLESQVKLLRFLEDRQFYRLGASTPTGVNIRILAATNRSLEELVQQGRYRDDLYWRLNVVSLELPPLRQRREDVAGLVQMYMHEFNLRHGRRIDTIDPAVIQALMSHAWPGNIRELRNTVERMVLLSEGHSIGPEALPASLAGVAPPPHAGVAPPPTAGAELLPAATARLERERIENALQAAGQSRTLAARLLGISRATLYYKARRLGLDLAR